MNADEAAVKAKHPEAVAYKNRPGFWECPHVENLPYRPLVQGECRWTLGWGATIEEAWADAAKKLGLGIFTAVRL